jgi:hypothetical protein
MEFEFDAAQSSANKDKHGIDFVEAQAIWHDPDRLEVPARSTGERRWKVVGRRLWSAFVTHRYDKIRIISVRRTRPEEEARYLSL